MLVQSKLKKASGVRREWEARNASLTWFFFINWEKQDEIHRFYRFEGHERNTLTSSDEDQCLEEILKST